MDYYQINARYNHIKLHGRCLFRINKELWKGKLSIKEYFRRGCFYTNGIIRALLPVCRFLQMPNYRVQIGNLCSPPSGSLMVSSSSTLAQV